MAKTKSSQGKRSHGRGSDKQWVRKVDTESTFPPASTFKMPAKEVARIMARPSVSPKGLGSAIRMVQYYINRAGKGLSATRKRELEKAKHLLQERRDEEAEQDRGKRSRPTRKRKFHPSKRPTKSAHRRSKAKQRS